MRALNCILNDYVDFEVVVNYYHWITGGIVLKSSNRYAFKIVDYSLAFVSNDSC